MNAATNDGLTGGSAVLRESDFTQLERQRVKNGWKEQAGRAAGRDLKHWFGLADVTLDFISPSSSFFFSIRIHFWGVSPVLIEKLIVINLLWSALPEKQSLCSASDGIFILLV